MADTTLRDKYASAVMQALIEASAVKGEEKGYLSAADASEALVAVLAILLEGAPNCRTPKDAREMAEAAARSTRSHIKRLREIYEATGRRPLDQLDAIVIDPS